MSDTSDETSDLQFETAVAGGIIEEDYSLHSWEVPVIRSEVEHLRYGTDRLAKTLERFPSEVGVGAVPQRIRVEIDALVAWLDDTEEPTGR